MAGGWKVCDFAVVTCVVGVIFGLVRTVIGLVALCAVTTHDSSIWRTLIGIVAKCLAEIAPAYMEPIDNTVDTSSEVNLHLHLPHDIADIWRNSSHNRVELFTLRWLLTVHNIEFRAFFDKIINCFVLLAQIDFNLIGGFNFLKDYPPLDLCARK